VKLLLENGAEVNAKGGNMGMHSRQHLLLENGAEVNAEGGIYGNALQA
jgi:hypothetical protein